MVEDGKEKVIGKREDITIEGDHIEKVYKSYSDIEFKDGVEYFEKDHKSGIYEEEPMTSIHFPGVKLHKIKSNNEIIHNGKMNIIYEGKNNKEYELIFKMKLKEYFSRASTNGKKGSRTKIDKFIGDIIIGLSQKEKLSDFDIKLKTIKNIEIEPGSEKKVRTKLNLDELSEGCYKILVIFHKKNGVDHIKGKIAHYSSKNKSSLFVIKKELLKKYNIGLGYKLKNNNK